MNEDAEDWMPRESPYAQHFFMGHSERSWPTCSSARAPANPSRCEVEVLCPSERPSLDESLLRLSTDSLRYREAREEHPSEGNRK